MTSVVKKNVLRLEVAVNDLEAMQALKRAKQLGGIETGTVDIESLLSLKVMEQFPTVHKRKDKI